jgi:hypothetical protein
MIGRDNVLEHFRKELPDIGWRFSESKYYIEADIESPEGPVHVRAKGWHTPEGVPMWFCEARYKGIPRTTVDETALSAGGVFYYVLKHAKAEMLRALDLFKWVKDTNPQAEWEISDLGIRGMWSEDGIDMVFVVSRDREDNIKVSGTQVLPSVDVLQSHFEITEPRDVSVSLPLFTIDDRQVARSARDMVLALKDRIFRERSRAIENLMGTRAVWQKGAPDGEG